MWPGLAVDSPAVVTATASRNLLEFQVDGLVWRSGRTTRTERCIVPGCFGRGCPARISASILILDDDAHTHVAVVVIGRSEHPNAGIVHFHDDVRPFSHIQDRKSTRLNSS